MNGLSRAQAPIDLHLHSDLSDGTDSPTEVVRAAHAAGVRTMSLTDHDTSEGWEEAAAECGRLGMTFIPGTEISVSVPGVGGMHLLAYLFDPDSPTLVAAFKRVQDGREERVGKIVDLLKPDYKITLEEVLEQAGGAPPQRPHIANVLVKNGGATSIDQVFAEILFPGSPYYIPTSNKMDLLESISLVREAGGVTILAHPAARSGGNMPKAHLMTMLEAGLGGLELDHQENRRNNPTGLNRLWEYHRELDFIVTGSSDYHGQNKVNRPGDDTTSPEMLERLIASARGSSGSSGSAPIYPPDEI